MNTVKCSCGCNTASCGVNPCAVTCGCCNGNLGDYAYIFNTAAQTAAADAAITFSSNGPLSGTVTHTAGTAETVIGKTGVYLVSFILASTGDAQVTAYRNGTPIEGATYSGTGSVYGQFVFAGQIGDVITFVNTGTGEITLEAAGTAPEAVVNASATFVRVF